MKSVAVLDERGNMLPLVVVSVFVLLAVVAFSVDQAIAYAAKARQENALDSARAACMDASFSLVAKNDDNPGRALAECVVKTVRNDGFQGRVRVWFYEVSPESLSSSERLWAIGMQLEEAAPTVFARGFGIESLPVASHRSMSATPYSGEVTWRPEKRVCGCFDVEPDAGVGQITFVQMENLSEFPDEIIADVHAALPDTSIS